MKTMQLKDMVEQAIRQQWPAFAENHPHLATVLEEEVLVDAATASLADDPDYQHAMADAAALGLGIETLAEPVMKWVAGWLRKLV